MLLLLLGRLRRRGAVILQEEARRPHDRDHARHVGQRLSGVGGQEGRPVDVGYLQRRRGGRKVGGERAEDTGLHRRLSRTACQSECCRGAA